VLQQLVRQHQGNHGLHHGHCRGRRTDGWPSTRRAAGCVGVCISANALDRCLHAPPPSTV
jgi:hypothetical protein